MRLRKFYVKSYRSIIEATLDNIDNYCVMVGPNNAGKSNLLKAIFISLSIALNGNFSAAIRKRRQYKYMYKGSAYDWHRDIPKSLLNDERSSTIFKLTFEFDELEKEEFKKLLGFNLSKSLQLKFELFSDHVEYNIIMPGKAKKPMEAKMQEIGLFIRSKLDFQYIPCVRSTEFTADYYLRLLNKELNKLEMNEEYIACVEKIKSLQQPIIEGLESRLTESLKVFLPEINNVKLQKSYSYIDTGYRLEGFYRNEEVPIEIDDGDLTTVDNKGDGVKSLVAIGLVESISQESAKDKSLILCIEEPEAHLHPDAIHSLRSVIAEIAARKRIQVIISTHSPILIDRNNFSNNVIVTNNHRVKSCDNISEIREVLGVRSSDNLSATKVVLVEGDTDKTHLIKYCRELSQTLKDKIDSKELEFVSANSASKMDYFVKLYNSIAVSTLVVLDSDDSGIAAMEKLIASKTKNLNEVLLIKRQGLKKAEIEDLIDPIHYQEELFSQFGINIDNKDFRNDNKPWSDRLKKAAGSSPGAYNDDVEKEIKIFISELVNIHGSSMLYEHTKDYVNNLISSIEIFATNGI